MNFQNGTRGGLDEKTDLLIKIALEEDLDNVGDLTASYFISKEAQAKAHLIARAPGVLAGGEVAKAVFLTQDKNLEAHLLLPDGSQISEGAHLMEVSGSARSILTAERTALNFLQRLSGIATQTRHYVLAVRGNRCTILDTRKTTPGWRHLEKQAVLAGGGENHRMNLYERVMIKDNHLSTEYNPSKLQKAINQLRKDHPQVEVELEADTLEQVADFLLLQGIDYILLDNMTPEQIQEALQMRKGVTPAFEASGGITLKNIKNIAETGVEYISIGALTHSAPSLDIGLDFIP